ncbi:MAG: 16S rRNA (cytidine(1402)-2'-O)-methyltransferase [Patescibacteria group bacterium]|jgi:16S rRNA (cytidine1402-2'-O)-methyltransferase
MKNIGKLFIVATPIGNLEDITFRAIRVLKEVDMIACEDTRHSRVLFDRYEIKTPTVSYFEANRAKVLSKIAYIISQIQKGKNIALVTDAGTPGISDPGQFLIQKATEAEIEISPIPGPSAFVSALSIFGFNDGSYLFIPFLPKKKGRQTLLKKICRMDSAIVFYESPHRVIKTLEDLAMYFSAERPIVICRELTKQFEEIFRGTIEEAQKYFNESKIRGEFVFVVKGSNNVNNSSLKD